ncbi:MAG: C39 family peptidase [Myxococcota bacterium]
MKRSSNTAFCLALCLALFAAPLRATDFWLFPVVDSLDLGVRSMQELKYIETIRQGFDFSCGSAAVATLLSHHYGLPTDELEVFNEMWTRGNQEKIRREGFSLLDMKNYLEARGFRADGFRIAASRLEEVGVAGIVLLDKLETPHFVLVVGARGGELLVSDPARGIRTLSVDELETSWNGVFFVIRGQATLARAHFNDSEVWRQRRGAPIEHEQLGQALIPRLHELPLPGEVNFN